MKIPTDYSPAVLDPTNYAYREREWRAPALNADETLIIDEPGRVLKNTCYRSHSFRVVQPEFGQYILRVRHGGGTEAWPIGWTKQVIEAIASLDSDSRFLMLHTLMCAHQESARIATERTAAIWRKAAAEKRLKTRKVKGGVKVWIEEAQAAATL
jgi:hypothetical protein